MYGAGFCPHAIVPVLGGGMPISGLLVAFANAFLSLFPLLLVRVAPYLLSFFPALRPLHILPALLHFRLRAQPAILEFRTYLLRHNRGGPLYVFTAPLPGLRNRRSRFVLSAETALCSPRRSFLLGRSLHWRNWPFLPHEAFLSGHV